MSLSRDEDASRQEIIRRAWLERCERSGHVARVSDTNNVRPFAIRSLAWNHSTKPLRCSWRVPSLDGELDPLWELIFQPKEAKQTNAERIPWNQVDATKVVPTSEFPTGVTGGRAELFDHAGLTDSIFVVGNRAVQPSVQLIHMYALTRTWLDRGANNT